MLNIFKEQQVVFMATALVVCALVGGTRASAVELTVDISRYVYEETDDAGDFFMRDVSKPVFFSAGIRDWDQPAEDGKFGFMYNGELTYGKVDYSSNGTGTSTTDYYKGRAEGYAVYRVNELFTPFIGLGYRHLFDDDEGNRTSTGHVGYDRLSQYLYAPVGIRFAPVDKLSVKAQYNTFLAGRQTSYMSYFSDVADDATNKQKKGWGVDFSANYQIDDTWATYGFFRHWDIKKSETTTITTTNNVTYTGWEPDNTTQEIGIGIAYKF
ncbi:MAG TPA: hypothetical protein QGG18_02715 [Rhodospirillales bacterium]|nr:hypothetical protein [Rhodospirillales bacterium]